MKPRRYILIILTLLLLVSPSFAGTGTISIYGTNASNAQANITVSGTNNTVNVTAWNVNGIKTFYVNVTNTSDNLTFLISNNTIGQIDEVLINGASILPYQVNATGIVNFIRMQTKSNYSFTVRPSINQGGYNFSWLWVQNLYSTISTTLYNNVIVYNATAIIGDGSGLSNVNASNLTNLQYVYKNSSVGNAVTTNYTTTNPILANSSNVWVNGLHQTWNSSYTEWSHGINFTAAPGNGYTIDIEYIGS